MRLSPNIRYGTERYPEPVARRLRALNVTVWFGAWVPAVFAVIRLFDGNWDRAIVNASFALVLALVPLLHRFGAFVAPLALIILSYGFLLRTSYQVGTGGGAYLHYLTATVVGIIFLGTERFLLNAVLAAVAAAAIITLHLVVPPNTGLLSPTAQFYGNFVSNVIATCAILFAAVQYAITQITRAEGTAARELQRSELLLSNILPVQVAARLKEQEGAVIADSYAAASILFVDMAGFTSHASDTTPEELVRFLDHVFTRLDDLVQRHDLEKIKTTGDSYMVVSGVPEPRQDHAAALADLALDMRDELVGLVDSKGHPVPVRMGIASGPVVAGIVGARKFFYDVWGDAVNVASRMESTGEPGEIQVAPETHELIKDRFEFLERGLIDVRGKGQMRTRFLIGRKSAGTTGHISAQS